MIKKTHLILPSAFVTLSRQDSRYCRGLTLFELMVVVAVISIVGALLLNRLQFYQEMAEKAAMEQTVVMLRSALRLQVASYIVKGKLSELETLTGDNPMNWLSRQPANYLGEYANPHPSHAPAGKWYYDRTNQELVYWVNRGKYFIPDSSGEKRARFRVVRVSNDSVVSAPDNRELGSIELKTVEAYVWGGMG